MSPRYSLDSVVVRGRRIFGWGFCLGMDRPIRVRSLRLPLQAGGSIDLDVLASGLRQDLADAFPAVPQAAGSGFMVTGRLPSPIGRGTAFLVIAGSGECLPLPGFPDAYVPATDLPVHRGWARFRAIARQRGWREALAASWRGVGRRLALLAQPVTPSAAAAGRGAVVVLDHGMGGGANRYRDERIAMHRREGGPVVLVASELSTLSYRITVMADAVAAPIDVRLDDQAAVIRFIQSLSPAAIEINDLVGYEDVPALLAALVELRQRAGAIRFRFNLHDFHGLCPSFTLIDVAGRHCGVPDLATCAACLPANARFTLGMNAGIDLVAWRRAWAAWLALADERVAFSRSAVSLLARGLPDVAAMAWRIEPHALDGHGLRPVAPRLASPVAIVAVGHLNYAKGASLLGALARRAEERRLPLRFAVIGTVEGGAVPPSVRVSGAFQRDRLCDLLEAEGTGIALLPSICPETYSYVTDELMATGLPLAVLDLGAPAERVARYHPGLLLPAEGLDAQLDALVAFARRLGAFS